MLGFAFKRLPYLVLVGLLVKNLVSQTCKTNFDFLNKVLNLPDKRNKKYVRFKILLTLFTKNFTQVL